MLAPYPPAAEEQQVACVGRLREAHALREDVRLHADSAQNPLQTSGQPTEAETIPKMQHAMRVVHRHRQICDRAIDHNLACTVQLA